SAAAGRRAVVVELASARQDARLREATDEHGYERPARIIGIKSVFVRVFLWPSTTLSRCSWAAARPLSGPCCRPTPVAARTSRGHAAPAACSIGWGGRR